MASGGGDNAIWQVLDYISRNVHHRIDDSIGNWNFHEYMFWIRQFRAQQGVGVCREPLLLNELNNFGQRDRRDTDFLPGNCSRIDEG